MSLKRNILANYAAQIYVTLVGILILPMYLKYMGAEAYGLVGFFTMMQAWFNLLDMGFTPTVARETSRYRSGATDDLSYLLFMRGLQIIFFTIALLGGGAMFACAELISVRWLNIQDLPLFEVQLALKLMSVGVALRWLSGLYRGCISGSEQLVWLSGFNVIITTLRFVAVLPLIVWIDNSPYAFFVYQLVVSLIEVIGLMVKAYLLLPRWPRQIEKRKLGLSHIFDAVRSKIKYSLAIAFTSSLWVVATQVDKLMLSGLLPLNEYGYFMLAVTLAAGIMTLAAPLTGPLTIRMISLYSEEKIPNALKLYEHATSFVVAVVGPVAVVLSLYSKNILYIWTGDMGVALYGEYILGMYSIGFFFAALSAFPGYIQHALGDMRYHVKGTVILVLIIFPSMLFAVNNYQANGAATIWATVNFIFFVTWTKITHDKLVPLMHRNWLFNLIFKPVVMVSTAALIIKACLFTYFGYSMLNFWQLLGVCLLVFGFSLCLNDSIRGSLKRLIVRDVA